MGLQCSNTPSFKRLLVSGFPVALIQYVGVDISSPRFQEVNNCFTAVPDMIRASNFNFVKTNISSDPGSRQATILYALSCFG